MNILKKLKNNDRGASVVFALVVFIIAAIICVTIVHAALLNVGRTSSEADEERAYLATTSAAKLLRDCIGDATYVVDSPYIVSYPSQLTDSTEPEKGRVEGINPDRESIKAVIKEMAYTVYKGGTAEKTITITSENMPKVKGKLKMSSGYVLTAEIYVENISDSTDESYPLTVHFRSDWHEYKLENKKGLSYPGGADFEGDVTTTSVTWPLDGVFITRIENAVNP